MQQSRVHPGTGSRRPGVHRSVGGASSNVARRILVCRASLVAAQHAAQAQAPTPVQLPPSMKNSVVVLQAPNPDVPGGVTDVYLMGMSHVSKASVEQVKALVRAVKPDVVGIELCRDRLALLDDTSTDVVSNLVWHCRKIEAEGLPGGPEWPEWEEHLAPLLRCRPGRPITTQDIEADVVTLLGTGLFRTATPQCRNADYSEAPAFITLPSEDGGGVAVRTVPPLGVVRFLLAPRSLPPITDIVVRLDSTLKAVENPEEALQAVCAEALAASAVGKADSVPALTALLRARRAVAAAFTTTPVVVSFLGVESGRIEMTVRAARPSDPPYLSGFEESAAGGNGWGIDVFRPKKGLHKLSDKLYLPQEVVDALRASARGLRQPESGSAGGEANVGADTALPQPRSESRPWSRAEMDACSPPSFEGGALADTLVALLTGLYAKSQAQAARKVGVTPGAAWQAALQAGSEVGAQQVALIDRPTVVTERRLGDVLVAQMGARLGVAAGLVVGTLVAAIATDVLAPTVELAGFGGALGIAAGLAWPLIGPLREISALAEMSPEQIEDAVAVKEPISGGDLSQPLKLFGEDALLDWPGALPSVIHDRDTYMAKALAGAATGRAAFSPTYVRTEVDGQLVWSYMVPEGAPAAAAPAGLGDGRLVGPLPGVQRVVGIVGSAHVRGMVRQWDQAVASPADVDSLLTAQPQ